MTPPLVRRAGWYELIGADGLPVKPPNMLWFEREPPVGEAILEAARARALVQALGGSFPASWSNPRVLPSGFVVLPYLDGLRLYSGSNFTVLPKTTLESSTQPEAVAWRRDCPLPLVFDPRSVHLREIEWFFYGSFDGNIATSRIAAVLVGVGDPALPSTIRWVCLPCNHYHTVSGALRLDGLSGYFSAVSSLDASLSSHRLMARGMTYPFPQLPILNPETDRIIVTALLRGLSAYSYLHFRIYGEVDSDALF